ncbi:MAG: AmmeMemoRadiSam system radical SAM enzyme [Prolixibacteraceae bacterium]|nr:AmmeMemoRadiSam system radical SAM enzyme [Prolixibacteraceae bacterium]
MHEALHYTKLDSNKVQCFLCPHRCIIDEGHFGNCNARRNRNGILVSEIYGKIAAMGTDPIEKKPLYHFYPGSTILSMGTTGCNMHCAFCQNYTLSQCNNRNPVPFRTISPAEMAKTVYKSPGNLGIAFTYNEPGINFEYVVKTAEMVKSKNQKTVFISNGFIEKEPLGFLIGLIDAFNIDLKAFNNTFYKKYSKASLAPVLENIGTIAKNGNHLELTNLVIPTLNDDEDEFEDMCKWIKEETGENTVLHLSRYFPRYEMEQYPTPAETLFHLYDIASEHLKFVYIGNMATEIYSNTRCPQCGKTTIERTYYSINKKGIDNQGKCIYCGTDIIKHL